MPGIATHFEILNQTINRLAASGDPNLQTIAQVMQNNAPYAYLGAIGPSIADFIPADLPQPGQPGGNAFIQIWSVIFQVIGGDGTAANPGLISILQTMNDFLDKVGAIAAAEDTDALKAMSGQINVINQTAAALGNLVNDIKNNRINQVWPSMCAGMRPAVDVPVGAPVPPPETWAVRDFLHWQKPGSFVRALLARAQTEPDQARHDRFLAYAYGYLTSYVGKVCGSPFINSIVRAPERTQWWRHRWVNNYVDAWTYGFYETAGASMAGDTPTPGYDQWQDLCSAKLQQKLEGSDIAAVTATDIMTDLLNATAFPQTLPPEFGQFWFDAFSDAYGPLPAHIRVKPGDLNGAYILTWMLLWFQTSGDAIGCNPAPPMTPPSNCGDTPPWTDPSVPGDNGTGSGPPSPSVGTKTDNTERACGILLAILGVLTFLTGGFATGAAEIAGGIEVIINATQPDWDKLRCSLYWYRLYVYNGLNLLHALVTLAAFGPPYVRELANDTTNLVGTSLPYDSGQRVVKSQILREGFPAAIWNCSPSASPTPDWVWPPTSFESPQTLAYRAAQYPSFFVADPANPVVPGATDVRTGGAWPVRLDANGVPVMFGNAADNAVDVFAHLADGLPEWNLDGDRGLAYLTWQFANDTYTDPVQIAPEP